MRLLPGRRLTNPRRHIRWAVAVLVLATAVCAPAAAAETYEQAVEGTSGLVHFWPMAEASGSSFEDAVGGADASLTSGVTLGGPGGLVGDASTSALFDGSTGAASASVGLSGTHELTVEFWMKWTAYGADDRLALEFTPNFNEYPGGFLVDPDATPGSDFAVSIGSGGSRNTAYFERPSAGVWHYYAFAINTEASAEDEITPYVDGKSVAYTKTESGTGAGKFAASTLFWMSRNASSLFGAGSMQDLALYTDVLSASTIRRHYSIGAGGPKAAFTSLPVEATVGVPVRFDASGSNSPAGAISDYAWDFDGSKGYGTDGGGSSTMSHTFSSPGTYTVDLRVEDETGAIGTVSHTITVGAALGGYEQEVEETSGLAHFWPMDESSGSSFADLVDGTNAEVVGGVSLGEPGGLAESSTSALFDGSSGAAHAPIDLSGTHQLTVEFWMKWTAYGADDRLALEFTPNFNEYAGGFLVDPDATPGSDFAVSIGSGGSRNTVSFERPSAGSWHYYAFVIDTEAPAASEITPYVDGKTVSYTKSSEGKEAGKFADSALFWMSRDAGSLFGAGAMQDLAVYEGLLTKTTIMHHYETGAGISSEPTAAFTSLPVDATAGVPVRFDASGSSSPAGAISDYAWDFDGSKGYGSDGGGSPTMSHTFSSPGTYTVDLRVEDETGATGTVSHTITVAAALPPYQRAVEETSGIAHFWSMAEATGSAFADLVGGADAALTGGVTLGEGGGVLSDSTTGSAFFDGSTGAASAGLDLSGTHELTVEFWMKWTSYGADDRLALEFTPNFNEYSGGFLVDPDATPGSEFAVSIGSGGSRNTVSFERPSADAWHYYAFVIDTEAPAASEITPYVDGKAVAYTKPESGSGAGKLADSTLYWMSRDASSLFGSGSMQDLALYATALSAGTIESHYEIGATDLENTSAPSIGGSAEDEQTLSADPGSWTGIEPISYTYQWESCDSMGEACVNIMGATESNYTVIPSEVGETLRVVVTASNSSGTSTATSGSSSVIVAAPPANKAVPTLSGTAEEGDTLTASLGTWDGTPPLAYTYQWQRCDEAGEECVDVEGADGSTYKLEADDVGDTLQVAVTASNEVAAVTTESTVTAKIDTPVTLPANLVAPEISGTAQVGQALTTGVGTWAGTPPLSYAYQWETCGQGGESCAEVVGATEASYSPLAGDVGKTLRVVVTTSNGDGHSSRISSASAIVEAESPAAEANPCTDTWVGPVFGLWEEASNWSTGSLPTASDVTCIPLGYSVSMFKGTYEVGALYDEGALKIYGSGFFGKPRTTLVIANTSLPSRVGDLFLEGALEGPGTLHISGELESDNGVFSGAGTVVIESMASGIFDGAIIEGYTVTNEGTAIYPSGQHIVMSTEGSTRAVLINKGTFEDNGTEIEGEEGDGEVVNTGIFEKNKLGSGSSFVAAIFTNDGVVKASAGELAFSGGGAAGNAATGRWNKEGTGEILFRDGEFAVGETVNLDEVDIAGEGVTVKRLDAPASVLAPSLSGTPQAGQTLNAAAGSWSGAEPISYEYEWQRCNASGGECGPIPGATGDSYTLLSGEIGATIRVVVTAANAYGKALAASTVSEAVAVPPAPSNTTAPAISGIDQDGQKLAAGTGTWSAVAPLSYAYQWERCNSSGAECVEMEGEDSSEYELSEGDVRGDSEGGGHGHESWRIDRRVLCDDFGCGCRTDERVAPADDLRRIRRARYPRCSRGRVDGIRH